MRKNKENLVRPFQKNIPSYFYSWLLDFLPFCELAAPCMRAHDTFVGFLMQPLMPFFERNAAGQSIRAGSATALTEHGVSPEASWHWASKAFFFTFVKIWHIWYICKDKFKNGITDNTLHEAVCLADIAFNMFFNDIKAIVKAPWLNCQKNAKKLTWANMSRYSGISRSAEGSVVSCKDFHLYLLPFSCKNFT